MKMRVVRAVQHGPDIKELHLAASNGAPLLPWSAGAHIAVELQLDEDRTVTRHYSLLGSSEDGTYRIAVLRDPSGRGGSAFVHEHVGTGDELEASEPRNEFPLVPSHGHHILLAGGIGITPIMAMARQLQTRGLPFDLHYLVRSHDRAAFADELESLAGTKFHLHLGPLPAGTINQLIGPFLPGSALYACGPSGLLQAATASATGLGWPWEALHFESFGSRRGPNDQALTVELAQSNMTVVVAPGESILEKMLAAGAFVPFSCGRGECGSCFTSVLQGRPIHRDVCLSAQQRAIGMCPCVSWAEPGASLILDV
jgi:vanillate O-demethylase ferredoxin subunit